MIGQVWVPMPTQVPSPGEMAAYLLGRGWALRSANARWAEYSRDMDAETLAIEVPQQSTARDYARALGTLAVDLARIEAREPAEILRDVKAASMDIIRLAVEGASTRDGRIPVEAGRRVYEAARDLLLSAACSVLDPRPVYAKRKPDEAMKVLNTARFGQNEVGSFVLTIECSIVPRLQGNLDDDDGDADAPLERRTCVRLAQALQAAEIASRESAASNRLDPFRTRIHDGVSANLCESLAELITAAEADRVRAGFSFASRRPLKFSVARNVAFGADAAPFLREAAKQLRYETALAGVEAVGPVVKLSSADATSGGEIVMQAVIDGKSRSVRVVLEPAAYQAALTAHRDGVLIRCTGDLVREGRSWLLRTPRELSVATVLDEE